VGSSENWAALVSGKALEETMRGLEQQGFVLLERALWEEHMQVTETVRVVSVALYEALDAIRKLPRTSSIRDAIRRANAAVEKADEAFPRTNI
jgi:hypothetical protein